MFLGYKDYIFSIDSNVTTMLDSDWKLRVHQVNGWKLYKLNWSEFCRLYKASLDRKIKLVMIELDDPAVRSYFISSKL